MRRKNLIMFLLFAIFLLFPFHGYADAQDDVQKGIDAMQRGDFDRSIDLFSNAISSGTLSSEDLASAYFGRGLAWRYKGEDDKAISDFTRAIQMNPNDAAAYNMRAGCYNRKGRFDKALPDFEKALKLAPAAVLTNNDLAWFLATCPDAGYRNGARALELSQNAFKAARKGKDQVVLCATLDTMGAAYAEAGKFDRAIATQKKVIALLKKLDAPEMLVECRERLDAYKAHRAWREK